MNNLRPLLTICQTFPQQLYQDGILRNETLVLPRLGRGLVRLHGSLDDGQPLPLVRMILQPGRVPGQRPAEAGGRGRQHRRTPGYQQLGGRGVRDGGAEAGEGGHVSWGQEQQ